MDATVNFLVVHALRVKGLASADDLADITGLAPADLSPALGELVGAELVKLRTGRIGGYTLTAAGRESHAGLVTEHVTPAEVAGISAAYEAFLPVNGRFKDVCTRWQLRPGPTGEQQPNDHTDAAYDAGVVDELATVHKEVADSLTPAVAVSARFGRYPVRFGSALDRVRAGDAGAFARPMSASYHDVWMELHEDFLHTLGRERGADDGH